MDNAIMNKTFSATRLGWLLKKDWTENKKTYLTYGGFYVGILLYKFLGSAYTASVIGHISTIDYMGMYMSAQSWGFLLLMMFAVTAIQGVNTKEERVNTLMLPASNSEKFAACLLRVTLGAFLFCLFGLLLADITAYLLANLFFDMPAGYSMLLLSGAPVSLSEDIGISANGLFVAGTPFIYYAFLAWFQSLYMVCLLANYWRKSAAVKVLLGIVVGCIVLFSVGSLLVLTLLHEYYIDVYNWIFGLAEKLQHLDVEELEAYGRMVMHGATWLLCLLTLFHYWLSYKFFTRIKIIA